MNAQSVVALHMNYLNLRVGHAPLTGKSKLQAHSWYMQYLSDIGKSLRH